MCVPHLTSQVIGFQASRHHLRSGISPIISTDSVFISQILLAGYLWKLNIPFFVAISYSRQFLLIDGTWTLFLVFSAHLLASSFPDIFRG